MAIRRGTSILTIIIFNFKAPPSIVGGVFFTFKPSDASKNINLMNAGVNYITGFKFNNGFLLCAGYNLGLTNFDTYSSKTVSNRVGQFAVGFQFLKISFKSIFYLEVL